ncbi:MAG: M14 family metallopeptidase [Elusimicrobiota bacterium]|nr:M14 family metallopeptidase [Elusimicrobiota bacterium]
MTAPSLALSLLTAAAAHAAPGGDRRAEPIAFRDHAGATAALHDIARSAPELASVFSIGRSVEGRDIWALRLNARARGEEPSDKPGVVFIGTIHAREHLSTEVTLEVARRLVAAREEPAVAAALAGRDAYFIPMLNPDGVEYDIAGGQFRGHRKNARRGPDGAVGVDLNRNFPVFWGGAGSTDHPADDRYRGPSPLSEPETRALVAFAASRPNLAAMVSYHTYGATVGHPPAGTTAPLSDGEALTAFRALAGRMGELAGYSVIQNSSLYLASGDLCDWAWFDRGLFCFTVEMTPTAGPPPQDGPESAAAAEEAFYPGATSVANAAGAQYPAALFLLGAAGDPRGAAAGSLVGSR